MATTDFGIALLGSFDVVLAPSYAEATALGARAARELPQGLMSCEVTTIDAWVAHLWELFGDGRRFAGEATRVQAMRTAIRRLDSPSLPLRPRTAIAAAQAHRQASGLAPWERALAGHLPADAALDPAELALLAACASYDALIEGLGFVEQGQATALLAARAAAVFSRPLRVAVVGAAPLTPQQSELLSVGERDGQLRVAHLGLDSGSEPPDLPHAPDGVSLRFAFPSGSYAMPQLVLDIIDELGVQGPMVVSAKDPAALYDAVAPALAARGVTAALRGSRAFCHTALGRAYLSLDYARASAVGGSLQWDKPALADAPVSPVVRHPRADAWRWDEQTRSDRLLSYDEALSRIAEGDPALCALLEVVEAPSQQGLDAMDQLIDAAKGLSPAERDEQHDALAVVRELALAAEALGTEPPDVADEIRNLLEACTVAVRGATAELPEGQRPDVLIEGLSQAATTGLASCATMVALDLDSTNYPSAERENACALLLDKLGVPRGESQPERLRRQWDAVLAAPTANLVVGRCLNDADANPTYPAAILEELVDYYRTERSATSDIDNVYAIPSKLQVGMFLRGEESLLANVAPGIGSAPTVAPVPAASDEARLSLIARREAQDPGASLVLSPAQIEAYLLCPGLWLATRRLSTSPLDEGFGPREQGSYRHDVLQTFYELFRKEGHAKVTPSTLGEAARVMQEAMAREDARVRELTDAGLPLYARNRCVAQPGTTEERAMERMRQELMEWLPFEVEFLRGPTAGSMQGNPLLFTPRAFELSLGDVGVSYAGAMLVGRLDRVDVNETDTQAVIVDYKGQLGPEYQLELKGVDAHVRGGQKVQALVYASAVNASAPLRRRLRLPEGGGPCVGGALYVSYRRGNEVRGHYVKGVVEEGVNLPQDAGGVGLEPEQFASLLARVEEDVAHLVVEPLLAGNVEPAPASPAACRWCPNVGCPQGRR